MDSEATKLPLRDEVYRYANWVREGCDGLPFDEQLRNRIAGDIEMMYEAHPKQGHDLSNATDLLC